MKRPTFENLSEQLKQKVLDTNKKLGALIAEEKKTDQETQFAVDQLSRCLSYISLCELTYRNATKTITKLKQKNKKRALR